MSTGAIIAIAVIAAIILIALFFIIPRMRRSAAERRIRWEREKRAEEHRERAKVQHTQAELAEQEARKQRAEAEINAKRAELHEHGLADHELESSQTTEARHEDPVEERSEGGGIRDRLRGGQRDRDEQTLDDPNGGGRFRDVSGGGRAQEPAPAADTHGDAEHGERRFVRDEDRETAATEREQENRTLR